MAENYQNDQNMFLDWNDTIESDGQEFITLEEGDYIFEVTGFERGRFPGGQKIPACNKAALTLQVKTMPALPLSRPTCSCTKRWNGSYPRSSAASGRRSTASV